MKKDFILPDIGEGIVECEVIEWKVKEGDIIVEDQIIVDVSTDKAIVEIPSMYNGRVTKLYYAEGDIAKVHRPLFALEVEGSESTGDEKTATAETLVEVAAATSTDEVSESSEAMIASASADLSFSSKVLTTPAVRKMAREHELDLSSINGSGKQGRVLKEDVLGFLSNGRGSNVVSASNGQLIKTTADDRVEPIRGVRKIMAERMSAAVSTIPHFTYVDEMDVTELMEVRQTLKDTYATDSLKITLMPLFIKALSLAIKQFPIINSHPNTDFTELTYVASHNVGMAVDGKTGLLVPNIKNVQDLSLLDIATEVTRLTQAARSGKINPQELSGGTITISNIGAIGGTAATPIINKPEVAIVALGKIQTLPRFDDQGNLVPRKIMTVSWSGDHRVIDGGTIARFNNVWMGYLKSPTTMLAAMI
jgi:2-oxoisovalerate dehydrogenase E2 component (dihydrolipoyl transacylase)